MKASVGGSLTLFLTVLIITAILPVGCGVGGGGGGGGGTTNATTTGTPPDINVSSNQLLFGAIVRDNFTDRSLTVQNRGTFNLKIGSIAWNDPLLDPPFSIVIDGCSLKTLGSMQTCTVRVRFEPVVQGAFVDTFDIPSNDPDQPVVTVTVSGDGKGLNVSINQVVTNCPTLTVYITVSDSNGDPLVLTQNEFTLFENGVSINPGDISFDDTVTSPKSIALVLDISASMELRDAIDEMQAAAVSFVGKLTAPPDEAEIIRFAKSVEPAPAPVFTSNVATLEAAINTDPNINPVEFRDGTAMYDAVSQAIAHTAARGTTRRRAVVVIADGRDNSSLTGLGDLIDQALAQGVPVFTIGLGDVNAENMQQLADETGGQYYYAPDENDLDTIYNQISDIISSQYVLEYDSSATCGDVVSLDVVVTDGGLQGEDSRDIPLN
jgi:Ca-activated chloride channel family protein